MQPWSRPATRGGFDSEPAERGAGDEVALQIESVVYRSVDGKKRWADAADLKRCIFRSRRRTTLWVFSARLYLRRPAETRAACLMGQLAEGDALI